jgi:hypothetical protein
MFSVLMLSVWQELAGLLEKNQGIRKLQLNSINVGDEVRFLFNSFTSSRISGLVAPEVRLNSILLVAGSQSYCSNAEEERAYYTPGAEQ